jgi:prepilin-type N-terminal cleavage/methylation domain-containing protein
MTRRGLTLLEVILSLSLLSMLCMVAAGWSSLAAAVTARDDPGPDHAVRSVLARIHDDLVAGDWPAVRASRRARPRVIVDPGRLSVATRAPGLGPIRREYVFDPVTGELHRRDTDAAGREVARRLLDQVHEFACRLDVEDGTLTVSIRVDRSPPRTRRYRVP